MREILVIVTGMTLIAGCAQNKPASKEPVKEADFDKAREPAMSADTHFAAGQFAETQNNPARALDQYKLAIQSNPQHKASLYRLGVLYTQAKQWPDAIKSWDAYIKATNGSAVGYSNLGFCYQVSDDAISAEKTYQAGIVKDPKSRPCRINYGLMLAKRGDITGAMAQWHFVLTEAESHYNLASVYEQARDMSKARAEYQKAIELDPKMVDARTRLAGLEKD